MPPKATSSNKITAYADAIFLTLIGILIGKTLFRFFNSDFMLSLNTYLGFGSWILVVLMKLFKYKYVKHAILILLVLAAFNILNFTVETIWLGSAIQLMQRPLLYSIGINPGMFLLAIGYSAINRSTISKTYKARFGPSEDEVRIKQKTMVNFYNQKFKSLTTKELEFALKNIKDYPHEAQIALNLLRTTQQPKEDSTLAFPNDN
ncbi:hypothetical protein [Mucilaginibacter agri]|uniref:Uncharacterized protein n=1 Tax=Mucilaginibacter agri TaxID=2695265 RepID=A0A965ZDK5_9SPHI|nr:hypothetical protein [Mucilaginibacter agri]NCD68805.1 hypothetical protein [Mucilaginibacter agri]